jgi:hypothetical protein
LAQLRKQGRGSPPPPPLHRRLIGRIWPVAVVGRRENGLGVTPIDGDLDLGRRVAGGSPWWAHGGDDDRVEGFAGEVVGRLWLAQLVRLESTSELRRRYG